MFANKDANGNIITFASVQTRYCNIPISDEEYKAHLESLKNKGKLIEEIDTLKNWFDTDYARAEQKYRRLATLGLADDDGVSAEEKIRLLYVEAEEKRARIQVLEKLVL